MRKMLLPVIVVFMAFAAGCNNTATTGDGHTDQEKQNLEASKAISDAFRNNEPARLDTFIAADFVDHTDMGDKTGVDSLKNMVQFLHTNMENMKMDVKERWANGDYVTEWVHYTGTVKEGAPGMPPGPFDIKGIELTRFNNESKAVEHWFFWDGQSMSAMMQQMSGGDMNHMQQMPMHSDTTKQPQ